MTTFRRASRKIKIAALWIGVGAMVMLSMPLNAHAAAPTQPTISVTPAPLTPFTSGGCIPSTPYPCYRATGIADPGVAIRLVVSDDSGSGFTVSTTTWATVNDDPGAERPAGSWAANPNVTDLGAHGADPSVLTFTAVAIAGGAQSMPAQVRVTKESATIGDRTGPQLIPNKFPPGLWCHLQLACGDLCVRDNSCSGEKQVSGYAEDDHQQGFGYASEIGDVVIKVLRSADLSLVHEYHSFKRTGTRADYSAVLKISDYPPDTYVVSVQAFDALGNASDEFQSPFRVLPI